MSKPRNHFYFFSLNVPYQKCQALYDGGLPHAILTSDSGQRVQIPVVRLKQCINSNGLKGRYRLTVDENHKFIEFVRVTT
ncbi:DUF2835 family protein [Alteromonas sediminis]|uniref:DUF2835 family protein n=1 Tax=Alteromonas sediminis TaxID=2259342 RepID=A0A3N5Y0T8_9ALTE|nr:DUF2835 family protein [Alteromonas sediminis]RPJ67337.1 DUF2835 family protein [Alteromonas sediminis]